MKERFLIFVSIAGIVGGIAAIAFVQLKNRDVATQEAFTEPVVEETTPEPIPVAQGGITVRYYGGPSDVKTFVENGIEYALIKNPQTVGGLTFAVTDTGNTYYFAQNAAGERVVYNAGDDEAIHGYGDFSLVQGRRITDLFSATEYYIAYPDSTSARNAGFEEIPETGIANRYLQTQVARITNKNTGRSVIATIDHRSEVQNAILVSEAVGRELQLDNGATGNLSIELLPAANTQVGPVR